MSFLIRKTAHAKCNCALVLELKLSKAQFFTKTSISKNCRSYFIVDLLVNSLQSHDHPRVDCWAGDVLGRVGSRSGLG